MSDEGTIVLAGRVETIMSNELIGRVNDLRIRRKLNKSLLIMKLKLNENSASKNYKENNSFPKIIEPLNQLLFEIAKNISK